MRAGKGAGTGPREAGPAGRLVLISTPIGNAADITLRALSLLKEADVLVAEDTRSLRRLMGMHGIETGGRPVLAYHDHSDRRARRRIVDALGEGKCVVYASEAGTPLLADPGHDLVAAARAAGAEVVAAPGPSALLAALAVAGQPVDRFLFAGFPPAAQGPRVRFLRDLAQVPATLVLYEAPHRIAATLADAAACLGPERPATLCRELTKKFEEVRRGTLASLAEDAAKDPPRGEIVLVIGRGDSEIVSEEVLDDTLRTALREMSVKDAAEMAAKAHGVSRRDAYRRALALRKEDEK